MRWRQRARRLAFCSSLSARLALRSARYVRRCGGTGVGYAAMLEALRGLLDRRGGSFSEAVRVVGTLWRGVVLRDCAGRWLVSTLGRGVTSVVR